jgi:hypothetical protein
MSFEGLATGLLGVGLGAVVCFAGFRVFLLVLPIFGFFVGFMTGLAATSMLLEVGIFSSLLAFVVGIALGILFALLSYFYWWGAILVIAGTLGYEIAQWVIGLVGFTADGLLVTLVSIAAGLALAFVAFILSAPRLVAIVLTAFAGAAWLAVGVAMILGVIQPNTLTDGAIVAVYKQGWFWILMWGVAAAAGIVAQLQMTARMEQDLLAGYERRKPF